MSLRSAVITLLAGIAIIIIVYLVGFPLSESRLMDCDAWLGQHLSEQQTTAEVCDQQKNKGSVLFLVQTDDFGYCLIQAEKSPLLPRYRLLCPIPLGEGEIYVAKDFVQKITMSVSNSALNILDTKAHYKSGVWVLCFSLAVAVYNVVYAYRRQKRG